jgi:hypothetical protein
VNSSTSTFLRNVLGTIGTGEVGADFKVADVEVPGDDMSSFWQDAKRKPTDAAISNSFFIVV